MAATRSELARSVVAHYLPSVRAKVATPSAIQLMINAGIEPDAWQREVLTSPSTRMLLNCCRQSGKALHVETPIATPDGWTTMGEVRPGDRVFDERGMECVVEWVSAIEERAVSRVSFSDGSTILADDDHLWTTLDGAARSAISRLGGRVPEDWPVWQAEGRPVAALTYSGPPCAFPDCPNRAIARSFCPGHYRQASQGYALGVLRHPRPGARTITTREMAQTIGVGMRMDTNHSIPAARPLDMPPAHLPIDPYVLGVWLGDGHSAGGRITIADDDRAIVDEVSAAGYPAVRSQSKAPAPAWGIRGLHKPLRLMGLLGNKHIPPIYLRASIDQRMALIRGLMDTDGSAGRNRCEFTTTNRQLAADFYELAVSLGLMVTSKEARATLYGRDISPKWRIFFCPWFQPFRLERKAARLSFDGPRQTLRRLRFVVSVEPAGVAPVRCISVTSPSHLYLAGRGMIPTHNSTTLAALGLHAAIAGSKRLVLCVCPAQRQAGELYRKMIGLYDHTPHLPPIAKLSELRLEFAGGSRILIIPADERRGVRGYSRPDVVIFDEASGIPDDVFSAARPLFATHQRGKFVLSSTPRGQRGTYYEEWDHGVGWQRWQVSADQCPRISTAFLDSEQASLGRNWYLQEYHCMFLQPLLAVFDYEAIDRASDANIPSLFDSPMFKGN